MALCRPLKLVVSVMTASFFHGMTLQIEFIIRLMLFHKEKFKTENYRKTEASFKPKFPLCALSFNFLWAVHKTHA